VEFAEYVANIRNVQIKYGKDGPLETIFDSFFEQLNHVTLLNVS